MSYCITFHFKELQLSSDQTQLVGRLKHCNLPLRCRNVFRIIIVVKCWPLSRLRKASDVSRMPDEDRGQLCIPWWAKQSAN